MNVSSRTPEGVPSRCPLCHAEAAVEFSRPPGDAVCPNCGCLLWEAADQFDTIQRRLAELLGVTPEKITPDFSFREFGADSLGTVELVMMLEEEFAIQIPDDAAEKIVTVEDVIRYLENRLRSKPDE